MKSYLEFERDIRVLEEELEKLKDPFTKDGISSVDTKRISEIQNEIDTKLKESFSNLNDWQRTQVARMEERPKARYFIDNLFTDFINLSGDRRFAEDESILAGFAKFESKSVLVIGQEKGEDLDSRLKRNFAMVRPEGYRKCQRLMLLANKFNIPIVTIIDTPGAYAGIGSEKRGIAEAIASTIDCMLSLRVPVIACIVGEGGSGGAVALASANKVLMLENAIYSVISPEGAAEIIFKDPTKKEQAAKSLKLTANELLRLGVIDEIIREPIGGAHRNKIRAVLSTREALIKHLEEFKQFTPEEILEHRKKKFLNIGGQKSFTVFSKETSWIRKVNYFGLLKDIIFRFKKEIIITTLLIFLALLFLF